MLFDIVFRVDGNQKTRLDNLLRCLTLIEKLKIEGMLISIQVNTEDTEFVVCAAGQTLPEVSYIGVPSVDLVIAGNLKSCAKVLSGIGGILVFKGEVIELQLRSDADKALNFRERTEFSALFASHESRLIEKICELI